MDLNTTLPRRAIVTGAMSGIGRAVAEGLISQGGRVHSVDLTDDQWSHPSLSASRADVTDPASVASAFADAPALLGGAPDTVIHCAGVYRWKSFSEMTVEDWESTMRINGTGSFIVAREAASSLAKTGEYSRSIVLLTSVAYARGDVAEPCSAYSSSKGAVVSLARQLAVELGGSGIRVNAVAPGMIQTPMLTIGNTPGAVETLEATLPARRLGTADDVAAACLFLASGAADYITGTTLTVDGGYLAG
ncbi:SDR family NAD(P)-dependent oxidoreductase [Leucobacter luti]|uniref:SDR family NAD(P)-dependent oxidoreductase n=1 Tax=Leucobacter luti TaxID=340320 RepID=UPI003CFEDDCA